MKSKVRVLIVIMVLLIIALGSIIILYVNGETDTNNIKKVDDFIKNEANEEIKEIEETTIEEDYSWLLEKIGIQKEYKEIKTKTNQTVEVEATKEGAEEVEKYNVKMSLKDIGCDNNLLIAGWTIESPKLMEMFKSIEGEKVEEIKKGIEDFLELDLSININNQDIVYNYTIPEGVEEKFINSYRITKCLSDNEILIYEIFILDDVEVDEIKNIEINISRIIESYSDGAWEVANGNWNFIVKDIKKNSDLIKEYDLPAIAKYNVDYADGKKGELKINKVINSKTASLIYVTSNLGDSEDEISVFDPECFYCFEITDANGKLILDKTLLEYVRNETFIMQEKIKEEETYNINIYKIINSDIYFIQPRISDIGNGEFIKVHSQEFKLGQ